METNERNVDPQGYKNQQKLEGLCKWLKETKGITRIGIIELSDYLPEYEKWVEYQSNKDNKPLPTEGKTKEEIIIPDWEKLQERLYEIKDYGYPRPNDHDKSIYMHGWESCWEWITNCGQLCNLSTSKDAEIEKLKEENERLKEQIEKLSEVLSELCNLKDYKDNVGRDNLYKTRQPLAWKRANELLNDLTGRGDDTGDPQAWSGGIADNH